MLEVDLGRRCAMSAAVAWATLAMLATLIYIRDPTLSDPFFLLSLLSIIIPFGPALAGLAVSGTALMTKRGRLLGGHLFELHNLATFAGLGVSGAVVAVATGIQVGSFSPTILLLTYPLGVAGVTLGMLGYLLTWQGWSARKVVTVLSSIVPAVLFVSHALYPTSVSSLLVWEYLVGGGLYLVAGILFLVSMTATAAAEREIVRGADERVAAEYARIRSLKEELDDVLASTSARAGKLEEQTAAAEARHREAEDYAAQAVRLKEEAQAAFDRAAQAEAAASSKLSTAEARVAALDAREKDVGTLTVRRQQEEREVIELRKATIQQKAEAEAMRRKIDAERQAVAEQLAHAKRERESARATLEAAEQRAREAESLRAQASDLKRQADEQQRVLGARASAVDSERVKKLEEVQAALASERAALEQQRAAAEAERAKVQHQARSLVERESTLATRATELDTLEKSIGDAISKLSSEKAEVEALRRQGEAAMAEAGERTKSYSESYAKVAERESSAKQLAQTVASQQHQLAERENQLKRYEQEVERRVQQVAAERKALASERERVQADVARLKEREEAIFHFEKHPDFAREAELALARDLSADASARVTREHESAAARKPTPAKAAPAAAEEDATGRLSFGNPRFDELVGGGLPPGSSLLVVGPAFCGKEAVPLGFISAGLAAGMPAIIVTTMKSAAEIYEELGFMCTPPAKKNLTPLTRWVDCSGKSTRGEVPREHIIEVGSPADFAKIKEAIASHFTALRPHTSFRFAYLPLTESWRMSEPTVARTFVQQMVAATRKQGGGAVWVAESGVHSADEIESLAGMMQGVVRCQEQREGHALRVQGVSGLRPHQWVKYKHGPKGLELGSFELERIR